MQVLKDDIKNQIIQAAADEFLRKGYTKGSMRMIAKKAQTSTSNLYKYFKNKEDLFYAITDPVYYIINTLIKKLFEYKDKQDFGNEQFMERFTKLIPQAIFQLVRKNREELLLILDCSRGTKYESFKDTIITNLETNFIQNLKPTGNRNKNYLKDSFILHIVAMNLLEGLLEISRQYKSDQWAESNIDSLMKYHIRGMVQFCA